MKTFTARLLNAFEKAGIHKAEIARRCGVSRASVTDWLNGNTKEVRGPNLVTLAAALKVRPDWLATGKGPREPGPDQEAGREIVGELSPEEETLVLAWRALPVEIKRHIHSLCTEYAAIRLGVPALKNGTYEDAEKANGWIEPAQIKARNTSPPVKKSTKRPVK